MDADLQHPPELIPQMIQYWEKGYDDVYAKRKDRKNESFFKRISSNLYYHILQSLTKIQIQKDTGDFRLLDRRCLNALKEMRETNRNSKSMFSWIGYQKKEIYFECHSRVAGKSKWNYASLMNLAIDGITSFTISPLRISIYVAMILLIAFVIYFLYCIFTLNNGELDGYQVLILLVLFLGGMQFLMIGIIGEYLGRIFNESKRRPLYLVDEFNDQKGE